MSHVGNSPSRRRNNIPPHLRSKEGEQLYAPSVFRYKCIGYLELNSDHHGSPGTCHGIQSRLERVASMVPDTREASIKKFLDAAADYGTYVDSDDTTSDQKVKEIYTSRTLIYKQIHEPESSGANGMVIKDSKNATNNADENQSGTAASSQNAKSSDHHNIQKAPMKPVSLLDEDLIDKTEWSCYGSTHVHFLVLDPLITPSRLSRALPKRGIGNEQNSGHRMPFTLPPHSGRIAAITPENFGLSIRKIDSQVGHFTVADIGSIRICLETQSPLMDYGNNNSKKNSNHSHEIQKQKASPLPQGTMAPSSIQRQQTSPNKLDNDANNDGKKKPSQLLDWNRFVDFSGRVWIHMNQNVHALKEAVSDDFPGRTVAFGTKVVTRFSKTTEQTFVYMEKIVAFWKKNW